MRSGSPSDYPLRHVSIRIPWHDSGWTGTVCAAPHLNGACAKLKRIAGQKKDEAEQPLAGKSLEALPREQWPCCVEERATFMAPFETEHLKRHALADKNPDHYGHFVATPQRFPRYSAGLVPFKWLMSSNLGLYRDLYNLDIVEAREPELGYESGWTHEAANQKALLDAFAAHLRIDDSLCFFYAKHVPFVEGTARVIVGVGRVTHIGELTEYRRKDTDGMRGMVWERPVQHSIRPEGSEGFLLPYAEILRLAEQDASIDVERYTATAPAEHWDEFSYASELVTHDGAIGALLNVETALRRIEYELRIPTTEQRQWLNTELVRLWKVRGPFPGFGAVLSAFGLSRGIFVAHTLQQKAGENEDPWPLVDKAFADPVVYLPQVLRDDMKALVSTWKGLPEERRAYIKLLSRFELTQPQAKDLYEADSRKKRSWLASDREIIANPYRLYEITHHDPEGVPLLIIDRGVFPEDFVRNKHPLAPPSALESAADLRRVRAFCVASLESAAAQGHTLLPKGNAVDAIQSMPVRPACPVTGDMLAARVADMKPSIVGVSLPDGDVALQLERYAGYRKIISQQVTGRTGPTAARHQVSVDWASLLEAKFKKTKDREEQRARREKAAALKELAESRMSVLVGPAGAGKTTVLGLLCAQPAIQTGGILLLAPTGKARVRMQQLIGSTSAQAFTLAQFLYQHGRFDGRTARYHLSKNPKASGYGTIIVDECSMLTEDMLAALFDAIQGVQRLIFVGDPAQLPPIGAGRPFVDVIARLRPENFDAHFPRVGPGYAELTIERRQVGTDRPDIRLARWFSATPPSAGEDDIFSSLPNHPAIRFVEWKKPDDFRDSLLEVIEEELELSGPDDVRGFNQSLGSVVSGDYDYFNVTKNPSADFIHPVDRWQILSPLRGMPFGVGDINRLIHEKFRSAMVDFASRRWRKIPKPLGSERIVYGDKVINLGNHSHKCFPDGGLGYLANGEIGLAVSPWHKDFLNIEFSSQIGVTYSFTGKYFREEGEPPLELAYALTVHKAQGSQFNLVVIVLPQDHPILSRELIYTALTRHQSRAVIMHQGPRSLLKDLTSLHRSATLRRMTNLLQECRMVEFKQAKGSVFMQEGLIHRTSSGIAVRSKSELLIAEALTSAGLNFTYETELKLGGGVRYPDFTIEDDITDRVFFWEHLGMMEREDYKRAWTAKEAWYRENGIQRADRKNPAPKSLITTTESNGKFDMGIVRELIAVHFGR